MPDDFEPVNPNEAEPNSEAYEDAEYGDEDDEEVEPYMDDEGRFRSPITGELRED